MCKVKNEISTSTNRGCLGKRDLKRHAVRSIGRCNTGTTYLRRSNGDEHNRGWPVSGPRTGIIPRGYNSVSRRCGGVNGYGNSFSIYGSSGWRSWGLAKPWTQVWPAEKALPRRIQHEAEIPSCTGATNQTAYAGWQAERCSTGKISLDTFESKPCLFFCY